MADAPADGRPVMVRVRVRRMRCTTLDCPVQDVPGVGHGLAGPLPAAHHAAGHPACGVARPLMCRAGAPRLAALGFRSRGTPRCALCCRFRCPRSPFHGCWELMTSRCAAVGRVRVGPQGRGEDSHSDRTRVDRDPIAAGIACTDGGSTESRRAVMFPHRRAESPFHAADDQQGRLVAAVLIVGPNF